MTDKIRLWACEHADCDYDGCAASEPCEGGNCGWQEYEDLGALLLRWTFECACGAQSGDESPSKVPRWWHGYYCSGACLRRAKAWQAKLRRAKCDWYACLARAGLAGHKAEYWGLCGDGEDPQHYPTGIVHTPTFSLTLRLGGECDVAASLLQWHTATGLPIPAPLTPDDPQPGQMSQAQWTAMLRDWLTTSGVGKAEADAWRAAEGALGLRDKWRTP